MSPQEYRVISSTVEEFREALLKVGPLKRVSKAQRAVLAAAHSLVLGLPLKLLGEHQLSQRKYLERV